MGEGYHALQTCLPPLVGGRGTTKWWRGAAEGGIIKNCGEAANTTFSAGGAVAP